MVGLTGRARKGGKALSTSFNRKEVPWWLIIRADGLIARTIDVILQVSALVSDVVNTIKQNW